VADFFGRKISTLLGSVVAILALLFMPAIEFLCVFCRGNNLGAGFHTEIRRERGLVYDSLKMIGQEEAPKRSIREWNPAKWRDIDRALVGSVLAKYGGLKMQLSA